MAAMSWAVACSCRAHTLCRQPAATELSPLPAPLPALTHTRATPKVPESTPLDRERHESHSYEAIMRNEGCNTTYQVRGRSEAPNGRDQTLGGRSPPESLHPPGSLLRVQILVGASPSSISLNGSSDRSYLVDVLEKHS